MKNELKPYIHVAQYYETDQMKIIHHSNYIRWFEEARIDFLDQVGANYAKLEANGIVSPVLTVEAQYRVIDVATGELRTTGKSQHCFLNEAGRPVSLKKVQPSVHESFEKYRAHIFNI